MAGDTRLPQSVLSKRYCTKQQAKHHIYCHIYVLILTLIIIPAQCMDTEANRLSTFANSSHFDKALPSRLARDGFFHHITGNNDGTVQCVRCGIRLSNLRGSNPSQIHANQSPTCPFVTGRNQSNIPLNVTEDAKRNYAEFSRTGKIPVHDIVDGAAFSETESDSRSRINGNLYQRSESLTATQTLSNNSHVHHSAPGTLRSNISAMANQQNIANGIHIPSTWSNSPTLTNTPGTCYSVLGNLPNQHLINNEQITNLTAVASELIISEDTLPGQTSEPINPEYSTLASRIDSYLGWPTDREQTPLSLAQAGFFYTGVTNSTRCFYCHGGLQNWLPGDEAWTEHARWFPRCRFVQQIQGLEFVQRIARGENVVPSRYDPGENFTPNTTRVDGTDLEGNIINTSEHNNTINDQQEDENSGGNQESNSSLLEVAVGAAIACSTVGTKKKKRKIKRKEQHTIQANEIDNQLSILRQETDEIKERNRALREAEMCKVCMDDQIAIVFLPCGHRITCTSCAANLRECPLCRALIRGTVKTYLV